jgi:DNA ligase 1
MPDLQDGESMEMKGSANRPYVLKNVGGVYSCSCPAWRNQSLAIERRTCKHLRKLRGDSAEQVRLGAALPSQTPSREGAAQAPALLLAESWDGATDPTHWWMSEKLDGVRAYWDGERLWSRMGNLFYAPEWFVVDLPKVPLDGELWLGRKKFQHTVSIVRRQDRTELWKEVRYLVFDAPRLEKGFEKRLEFIQQIMKGNQPTFAQAHEHQLCQSLNHVRQELTRLEALGGEGLMLRQAGSKYEVGRSPTLLKVKSFHDAEARVLKHLEGAGRHQGRLGALLVEMPDGTTFSVGTGFSDAEREDPPAVGSLITFRYQELSEGGVPRFPSFVGVFEPNNPSPAPTRGDHSMSTSTTTQPRRFEFSQGISNKFWEVTIQRTDVTVRFGRIGTNGQGTLKSFLDEAAARKHVAKLVQEKLAKGYREVTA